MHHMPSASDEKAGFSLLYFGRQFGVHEHLIFDGTKVQVGRNTDFTRKI